MHYWNLLWDWNTVESVRTVHSFLEGWALVFFALLVLFDVLAHLTEDEHREQSRTFERIGLWCFGVAVIAEIFAYPYSRRNDALSSQQDATQKATIARLDNSTQGLKTDAQHSKERADTLEAGLETERQKTARFERQANIARLELAKQIKSQGPRSKFIDEVASDLAERLKIFPGQSVVVIICGRFDRMTPELNTFLGSLMAVLNKAEWSTRTQTDDTCIVSESIGVYVNSSAGAKTRMAAEILGEILGKAVPFSSSRVMPITPPKNGVPLAPESFADVMFRALASNPEQVLIHVGQHP